MKIVFVSYNYSPDINSPLQWIERIKFYVGWLECLAKTHTVIRIEQINHQGKFEHNGVQYFCVDAGKRKNYFPRKLNHFVKNLKPDVVVVSSFLFPLQLIQLRLSLGKKVKIIAQHHAERPFTGAKKWLQWKASWCLDAGIFASMEIGRSWKNSGNLHKEMKLFEIVGGTSVFYPVEKKYAQQRTGVTGSPIFLWVGRLNENKDPLTAVKAFLKFSEFETEARLYMIYQTTELIPEIKKLLDAEGGINRIKLVGKIEHAELLYWYNSADFYLSASHYEGSGTALCEALSCGCLPVVTDIPSFRMISGGCGLLYEVGNERLLLVALKQARGLNIEEEKNKALQHFQSQLSFEAIATKFQELADSL